MKPPSIEELECLNGNPEGTVGYELEKQLATDLLELCETSGFDKVREMMRGIYDMWNLYNNQEADSSEEELCG